MQICINSKLLHIDFHGISYTYAHYFTFIVMQICINFKLFEHWVSGNFINLVLIDILEICFIYMFIKFNANPFDSVYNHVDQMSNIDVFYVVGI